MEAFQLLVDGKPGMLPPQSLSILIGLIYDCALDPGRWPDTLTAVREVLRFHTATIAHVETRRGAMVWDATSGVEQSWLKLMAELSEDTVALWGGPQKMLSFPLDEPVVLSAVTSRADWVRNRLYREWVEPQGLHDLVGLSILRDRVSLAGLAFGRHRDAGPVEEPDLAMLRVLAPHLKRAVEISRLLDAQAVTASTFEAVVRNLSAAVILVDGQLRPVHTNRAAERMLEAEDIVRLRQSRIGLSERGAESALRVAIEQAERDNLLGRKGLAIPARNSDGEPFVLHVLPLSHGPLRTGIAPRAIAAVFVSPAISPPPLPLEAITALFDLTPMEARVLEQVSYGRAPAEAARALGVKPSTFKTHLLRLFSKTGTRRQAELVGLLATFAVPVLT